MAGSLDILEFDLGQKWAKGLRLRFLNAQESSAFRTSPDYEKNYSIKQIHSNKIVSWSPKSPADYKDVEADGFFASGDAFKNSKKKLIIRTADCAPLFFVDRENECAASVHAGWRGLAQGIHRLPFKEGFDPKTTWIWCGPCLNGENFEVAEDMWSQFPKDVQTDPEIFAAGNNGKKFFFTWKYLEKEFKRIGVELFYNVEVDTFANTHYNSYRRWKKENGTPPLPHNYSWISFV